jgi:Recombination endonuclease VII
MALEDYEAFFSNQNGKCAICKQAQAADAKNACLSVDHDHDTGRVRGLLCTLCNVLIGQANDDVERLTRAAFYLRDGA